MTGVNWIESTTVGLDISMVLKTSGHDIIDWVTNHQVGNKYKEHVRVARASTRCHASTVGLIMYT